MKYFYYFKFVYFNVNEGEDNNLIYRNFLKNRYFRDLSWWIFRKKSLKYFKGVNGKEKKNFL